MGNKESKKKNVNTKEKSKAVTAPDVEPKSMIFVDKVINVDSIKLIISYWFRICNCIALEHISNIVSTYFTFESWYLMRQCSSYVMEDILLGIFNTYNDAQKAKQEYIKITSENDPYPNQGYTKVNLESDVVIKKHNDECFDFYLMNGMKIYVIGRLAGGLGQVGRTIIEWCNEQKFNEIYKKYILQNALNINIGFVFDTLYVNKLKLRNDNAGLDIGGESALGKLLLSKQNT
eukprot:451826_1